MAEEKISYSFAGDVNPLKKATEEALALLGQFAGAFQSASEAGNMKTSITSQKEFQRAVNATIDSLKKLSDTQVNMQVPPGVSSQYGMLGQSIKDVSDILMLLSTSTKTNSTDLQIYSDSLRSFRQVLEDIRTQISAYNMEFRNTTSATQQVTPAIAEAGEATAKAGKEFKEASGNIREAAENLDEAGDQAEGANQQMSGLSKMLSRLGEDTLNSDKGLQGIFKGIIDFNGVSSDASSITAQLSEAMGGYGASSAEAAAGASSAAGATGSLGAALGPQAAVAILAAEAMKKFGEAVLDVVKALAKLALNTGVTIVSSIGNAYLEMAKFTLGIKDADDKTKGLIETLAKLAIGLQLGKALGEAIKGQINFIENTNLFVVAMGKSIDAGNKFVDSLAEIYGLDPSNIIRATGLFNQLTSAMEAPAEASEIMSLGFTKAAIDMSSLFNVEFEKVTQDLTSGLQGMSRSVRKYGLDIRVSTLQQKALELGMKGQVEAMSESTRQGLRFIVMMEQASSSNGDFARTIESPANQLKVLKEQFGQLTRTIGSLFIPILQSVLPVINGFVMGLRMLIETIGAFFGIEMPSFDVGGMDDASDAIGGVGDAASGAKKKMQDLLAPWDELNVLAEQTASSAGGAGGGLGGMTMDPKVLEQIKKFELSLDNIRMKALDIRDTFLKTFGMEWVTTVDVETGELVKKLQAIPGGFADQVSKKVQEGDWEYVGVLIADKMNDGLTIAADFVSWDNIGPIITEGVDAITGFINGWAAKFSWEEAGRLIGNSITTLFNTVDQWFTKLKIEPLVTGFTTTITNAARAIPWASVGKTLADGINFAFDALGTFVATFPWVELATDITTALNNTVKNTDWVGVGASFNDFFNGALDFLSTAISTFDWTALGQGLGTAFAQVDWAEIFGKVADIIFTELTGALTESFTGAWGALTDIASEEAYDAGYGGALEFAEGLSGVTSMLPGTFGTPVQGMLNDILKGFTKTGKDANTAFVDEVPGTTTTPIGTQVKSKVVDPVNNELSNISNHSKQVGLDANSNFQAGVSPLASWYRTNVAQAINNATGTISTDLGTTGSDATTKFKAGVAGLPDSFSLDVTNPMAASMTGLTETANTESLNIDSAFKSTLGQLPGWNSKNITDPMTTAYDTMATSIISDLERVIQRTNDAITAANNLASANRLAESSKVQLGGGGKTTSPPAKKMATGGVVTRRMTVGEGRYSEAIVPLNDSPEMEQLLQKFAEIAGSGGGGSNESNPMVVKVYIGDKEWDSFTYESSQRGAKIVGAQPVKKN